MIRDGLNISIRKNIDFNFTTSFMIIILWNLGKGWGNHE